MPSSFPVISYSTSSTRFTTSASLRMFSGMVNAGCFISEAAALKEKTRQNASMIRLISLFFLFENDLLILFAYHKVKKGAEHLIFIGKKERPVDLHPAPHGYGSA